MKTKNDVRLAYKRDTGENADKWILDLQMPDDPDFDDLETLADDLEYLIVDEKDRKRFNRLLKEVKDLANNTKKSCDNIINAIEPDSVKYVEWLEEQVIKLSAL